MSSHQSSSNAPVTWSIPLNFATYWRVYWFRLRRPWVTGILLAFVVVPNLLDAWSEYRNYGDWLGFVFGVNLVFGLIFASVTMVLLLSVFAGLLSYRQRGQQQTMRASLERIEIEVNAVTISIERSKLKRLVWVKSGLAVTLPNGDE